MAALEKTAEVKCEKDGETMQEIAATEISVVLVLVVVLTSVRHA
jgi:hypothetical protein